MRSIYEFYNRGDEYQQAIYIDLLSDIIKVYHALIDIREWVNKTVENSKWTLKKTDNFIEWCKKMNAFVYYYKKNQFIGTLKKLMTNWDDDELIKIRLNRYLFIENLKGNGLIKEARWSRRYKKMLEELKTIPDDDILRKMIRTNPDWTQSFNFEGIKFYKMKFTAFWKTFYLDNPKVFDIYIPVFTAYNYAKAIWFANFNKVLNQDWEKEDLEEISFMCDIEKIIKLKQELITWESSPEIIRYRFYEFDLFINDSATPFRLNKTATSAIMKLQFLCYIFYMNPSLRKLNQEDLNNFYLLYKEKSPKFSKLTREHIKLDNLRSSLERTLSLQS